MIGDARDKGLSKSEISRLPVVTFRKKSGQKLEECNICMTEYEEGDSQKILPCFHNYHASCIDQWISVSKVTPLALTAYTCIKKDWL